MGLSLTPRKVLPLVALLSGTGLWLLVGGGGSRRDPATSELKEQREQLLATMATALELDSARLVQVRALVEASPILGQGNPGLSQHSMSRDECRRRRAQARQLAAPDSRCRAPYMVVAHATDSSAGVCIDQYEFPGIPCEYPVVHVTAREAALLCQALGKRLCDAHEWEGSCAGELRPPDREYAWGNSRAEMTSLHNASRELSWAYGRTKHHELCATGSFKTSGCKGGYRSCGSNTYPAGAFPECVSPFGVYDQHGNAAEHMNLPLTADELASAGRYGVTEMKGSWFIFASYEAHPDDCRWRAPDWHASRVLDPASHSNYHLGFRCCKGLPAPAD